MNNFFKNATVWIVMGIVMLTVFNSFSPNSVRQQTIDYSTFLELVRTGNISEVVFENDVIKAKRINGDKFLTYNPETDNTALIGELNKSGVRISANPPKNQNIFVSLLINSFPVILLIAVWIYFMRQMQGGVGGGRGAMTFGKSKARLLGEDQIEVTFADVAGIEEAKEEVIEIVEFLKDPSKFQRLGGKIPKGVLMVGSPGTGKTLLARAIAGEAKVPFFTISGSDFVEMFVGVGASRVRDMFQEAKAHSPCIIFIDEIDAVGRQRGAGLGGGHDEREQTLNQLLVEMDGFEDNVGVIVIAATNRPDVLDAALLRPGRFDRQVVVPLPDVRGREQILKVHMRKVPLDKNVKPSIIARGTPGFSGADLANLVNESALIAARGNKKFVNMDDLEKAKDKIMMGTERMFLPEDDRYSISKKRLIGQITSLFGGRVAEELIFGKEAVTTGASNDIERATDIARNMVTKWGLSDKLGPLTYSEDEGEVFLGRSVTQTKQVSDVTAKLIDEEVRKIIDETYESATKIINDQMNRLHKMAEALLKYETIDDFQIKDIMNDKEPRPPEDWDSDDDSSQDNTSSDIGGPATQH